MSQLKHFKSNEVIHQTTDITNKEENITCFTVQKILDNDKIQLEKVRLNYV